MVSVSVSLEFRRAGAHWTVHKNTHRAYGSALVQKYTSTRYARYSWLYSIETTIISNWIHAQKPSSVLSLFRMRWLWNGIDERSSNSNKTWQTKSPIRQVLWQLNLVSNWDDTINYQILFRHFITFKIQLRSMNASHTHHSLRCSAFYLYTKSCLVPLFFRVGNFQTI